jgi:hypothetical protein
MAKNDMSGLAVNSISAYRYQAQHTTFATRLSIQDIKAAQSGLELDTFPATPLEKYQKERGVGDCAF